MNQNPSEVEVNSTDSMQPAKSSRNQYMRAYMREYRKRQREEKGGAVDTPAANDAQSSPAAPPDAI